MPLYDFVCRSCGHEFEALVRPAEAARCPKCDGVDLEKLLSGFAVSSEERTRAAAITAYARAEDRALAIESGFQVHMPKPVDPSEVVRVVGSLAHRDQSS